ncbi:Cysteine-rich receptor-like protein kinase 25 [Panicum miliaceum]|uniref:Cysteine-rich receptor-like protein kinase 25 n=1 Tax=Panicum miliaceum TaxID=4540 RepID=A0A3L6R7Y0_PANMI|nr:Cysteine-rich receptor-like protein kinase 25 [Panicum miliaceum]
MALWRLLSVLLFAAATLLAGGGGAVGGEYRPFPSPFCSTTDNFTAGSTYQVNVEKLVHLLGQSAAENGSFFMASYGTWRDEVFSLIMCYADYSWDKCMSCVDAAVAWVSAGCPYSRSASVNYDRCLLRHSNEPFFGAADELNLTSWVVRSLEDAADAARMNATRWALVGQLTEQAAGSPLRFAYRNLSYTDSEREPQVMLRAGVVQAGFGARRVQQVPPLPARGVGEEHPKRHRWLLLGIQLLIRYNLTGPMEIIAPPPQGGSGDKWKRLKLIMVVAVVSVTGTVGFLLFLGLSRRYLLQCCEGRTTATTKTKCVGSRTYFRGEAVELIELEQGTGVTGHRRFSYDELAAAANNFSGDRKLGEGGFGSVYRGFLEDLNLHVAIKRVSKTSPQGWREFMSEVKIISGLRHRNVVLLIGWCYYGGGDDLLLVYELMHNGSVDSHLHSPSKQLGWRARYQIVLGIGSALVYLHQETETRVVHRDIKPSNVMLDAAFTAKLGDFGLARAVEDGGRRSRTTTPARTTGYLDPECVATGRTSIESDVYSFGVVLLEIASGRRPVATLPNGSTVHLAQRVRDLHDAGRVRDAVDVRLGGDYDAEQMERVIVVGLWCAHPDRSLRPTVRHAVNALRFDAPLPILPARSPAVAARLAPPVADALFPVTGSSGTPATISTGAGGSNGYHGHGVTEWQ